MSVNMTQRKKVTLGQLRKRYQENEPLVMLTCYDATFAYLEDEAGVDILLVGDSLGQTIQGHTSTLPVQIEDMVYHTQCVARGNTNAFILADMSFGSYLVSEDEAVANAVKLMKAGANMVKLEGGAPVLPIVRRLTQMGIPVCAHLGFTPQSLNLFGGYFVQGKTEISASELKSAALDMQEAGAAMVLFEMVPASVATEITQLLSVPTIGIGAGPNCSGQVLVLQDILGIYPGRSPKFSKNFMKDSSSIQEAVSAYVHAVKSRVFPTMENSF
ncbi:MAG: 3-methyl-2-oxobutanoate hydroxymethyltransferase [Burkholderiaceae bacterium]|nr:3-methyl-2-oxobutanoate hydroxymethyltransferase [Burkholderiaceae bacterium]